MLRFLLSFAVAMTLATSVSAACLGQDLRPGLTDAQRAEIDARVEATPYAVGNHWTATKGDETIHIIGTLHLDDPRLDAPVARVTPLIESAGVLLLEATKEDQDRLQRQLAADPSILMMQGETLIDLMPPEQWQALADAAKSRGIPPFMAAKFQPWYLSLTLAMPSCMIAEMREGQNGLDSRLNKIADAAGVPSQSLEDFMTLFNIFGQEPIEEQIRMLSAGVLSDGDSEDQIATTLASYFDEQVAESWQMSRVLAPQFSTLPKDEIDAVFDKLEEELLNKRNRAWIPVILKAADAHDAPIVAAFGAAHLTGDDGVLNLLAQQGFTLHRQPF